MKKHADRSPRSPTSSSTAAPARIALSSTVRDLDALLEAVDAHELEPQWRRNHGKVSIKVPRPDSRIGLPLRLVV